MTSLLDLCEQYFGARNFYDVLKISKTANDKQGTKKLTLILTSTNIIILCFDSSYSDNF